MEADYTQIFDDIGNAVERNGPLYMWEGSRYEGYSLTMMSRTVMNIVFLDPQGVLRVRRLSPYEVKGETVPHIEVSLGSVIKLTSGQRRGHYVPLNDLRHNESFKPAGISKRLIVGHGLEDIDPSYDGGQLLLRQLEGLHSVIEEITPSRLVVPDIYLTTTPNASLHVRTHGLTLNKVREMCPDLESAIQRQPFPDVVRGHLDRFAVVAGCGKWGYPYDIIFGQGVLAMSPFTFDTWRQTPLEDVVVDLPWVKVFVDFPPGQ